MESIGFETVNACPVCEGTTFAPAVTTVHWNTRLLYSLCKNCAALFLNPRMTDEDTETYYRSYYRTLTLSTPEAQERDRKVQQSRATVQKAFLGNELTRLNLPPLASHLEIGSSAGFLLDAIGAPNSYGVEPNDLYQDQDPAKKYPTFASGGSVPPVPMDLISMSHSLEHLNHPLATLKGMIEKHSRPMFLIEVPDYDYNHHDALLLHHPVAYNAMVLTHLFEGVGYEPLAIANHGLGTPFRSYLLALFASKEEK